MAEPVTSFDYVDLNEVDPRMERLPEGTYTLQILSAELQSGESRSTGKPWQCVLMRFAVAGEGKFVGRRLTERFFTSEFSLKALRRIMDATGIRQEPGQPISEWLRELSIQQPLIKVQVGLEEERDPITKEPRLDYKGDVAKRNVISWYNVFPAD